MMPDVGERHDYCCFSLVGILIAETTVTESTVFDQNLMALRLSSDSLPPLMRSRAKRYNVVLIHSRRLVP